MHKVHVDLCSYQHRRISACIALGKTDLDVIPCTHKCFILINMSFMLIFRQRMM